jgi:hypothetical protein
LAILAAEYGGIDIEYFRVIDSWVDAEIFQCPLKYSCCVCSILFATVFSPDYP